MVAAFGAALELAALEAVLDVLEPGLVEGELAATALAPLEDDEATEPAALVAAAPDVVPLADALPPDEEGPAPTVTAMVFPPGPEVQPVGGVVGAR